MASVHEPRIIAFKLHSPLPKLCHILEIQPGPGLLLSCFAIPRATYQTAVKGSLDFLRHILQNSDRFLRNWMGS